jgi:hypothetical protein
LLNQKLETAGAWLDGQLRKSEEEFWAMGGRDSFMEGRRYEDYHLATEVAGMLGDNHPHYDDEDEENEIVRHYAPVAKQKQWIFGRCRPPDGGAHDNWLSTKLHIVDHADIICPNRRQALLRPCRLFRDLWLNSGCDWLKMLSIQELWLEVIVIQRRIAQFGGGDYNLEQGL